MSKTSTSRAAERDGISDSELMTWPGHLLRRCHQRSLEIFNDVVGEYGVTRQQTAVLIALDRTPGATQQGLSDASGFDRNTLAEILRRLTAKDLIVRRRSDRDSRAYEISLTDAGRKLLKELLPRSVEVQRRIVEPLPPELRDAFIKSMRIIVGLEDAPKPAKKSGGKNPAAKKSGA